MVRTDATGVVHLQLPAALSLKRKAMSELAGLDKATDDAHALHCVQRPPATVETRKQNAQQGVLAQNLVVGLSCMNSSSTAVSFGQSSGCSHSSTTCTQLHPWGPKTLVRRGSLGDPYHYLARSVQ